MKSTPRSIQQLVRELNKLPGIGSKTSERFVYHLLRQPADEITALASTLLRVKDTIRLCSECYTYAEDDRCGICSNSSRDRSVICVVAEPKEVIAIESTGEFDGVYHVLGGVINHTEGIGPAQLRLNELEARAKDPQVKEVIVATNPDMEGETTAILISQQLQPLPVSVTRIARGLPSGADIVYADEVTLGSALAGRQQMRK